MLTYARSRRDDESGFTLVELMVAVAILVVVLAIAGGALISLLQAANRTDSRVAQQQTVGTTLAAMARDVRSAHSLSTPAGASATQAVLLQVNNPAGGTTPVEWVYDPASSTVKREVLNGAGAVVSTGWTITRATLALSYFNDANTAPADIAACTTRLGVQLTQSSTQPGVPPLSESEDVSMIDQVQILSAPGNGQC